MRTRIAVRALIAGAAMTALAACSSGAGDAASSSQSATAVAQGQGTSASESVAAETGDIVIGASIAKTGFLQPYDVPAWEMVKLRIDEINAAGGIDGRKITTVETDTESKPENGGTAALDAIDQGAQIVFVTCDFDYGSPAAIAANDKGVLAMSLCAASPKFGPEGIGPLSFTAGTGTPVEGAAAAQFILDDLGKKTAYMLYDDSAEYFKTVTSAFQEVFEANGGTIVGKDTFKFGDTSLAAQVSRLKALDPQPDVVYYGGVADTGVLGIKTLRDQGVTQPIVTTESMEGNYWLDAVPGLSDLYQMGSGGSFVGNDPRPEVNQVLADFKAKTGEDPFISTTFLGYAGMQILEGALTKVGGSTNGAALAEALVGSGPWPTIVGDTTFTDQWHISLDRDVPVYKVDDGKVTFDRLITPESVPAPQ
jgi:branched-chain amino acid transport system substrate-binding protein